MVDIPDIKVLETACAFGSQCQLTGIYTAPTDRQEKQPCALFLTAGLLHHIGPTRLHVELARSLATQGVAGLRFDLSGAGDSESSSLGGDFTERSIREVTEAMDYLQHHHDHQHFVLLGLCSGADDALATAQRDPRVVGIALLNGYAYPAGRFKFHRVLKFYLPRLFMWQKLLNRTTALRQRVQSVFNQDRVSSPKNSQTDADQQALIQLDDDYRYIPPQSETGETLMRLCTAETDILFLYTGSEHDTYTYEGQLRAMFPELSDNVHLAERYLPKADHTLILKEDRETVVRWTGEWFSNSAFSRTRL
ncbi:alpha/beta fold hydrolase [Granulosicoccus antarcticus]|uniref:Serine aminopeptidase S33 domain-containing protein n=1 Tax=Granulosicoccus antarcticus IMCC3135 TaxID=1192854 RepID=A0A2Z2NPB5_9GAMM|nr:alpha/beta fold hydrolase [Granulosicoccus antarcticus]ASJ71508.1 hypothetical protein IMCC3135_07010 [Granulosicoccus antarcticus IMCC3135]